MAIGIGIGMPFIRRRSGASIDPQAQAHFDRVIADGGIVPAGIDGINSYVKALKSAKGGSLSTMLSGYEPHYLGLKTATGVGATAQNRAAAKVYNLVGSIGDQVQTNPANQPLALVHSGAHYGYLSGVNDNSFSTPNNVNNQLIGDFSIEFIGQLTDFTTAIQRALVNKASGSNTNTNFIFLLQPVSTTFRLSLVFFLGSTLTYNSTVAVPTKSLGFRVSRNATTGIIKFFTTSDKINWVQLGADVAGATGNINNGNFPVHIGQRFTAQGFSYLGTCDLVRLFKDDSFTTPTQIFNPANYNRATSQTTWTSTTGETWTLNTANTNNALKAAIVDRTMIMGNGTTYGMTAASLNMVADAVSNYTIFRRFTTGGANMLINELSADVNTNRGKYLYISSAANVEEIGLTGNVGNDASLFDSSSTNLKLVTAIQNVANANENLPYLVNNVSQSLNSKPLTANNTAGISATGYNLLARNNAAALWANVIFCGDLVFSGEDDSTVQTAMYNAIKTFTNGI
jgi:hypothetical protein